MKTLDLQPTTDNIMNTFVKDILERNDDIYAFIGLLNIIEQNYSLALDGAWGSGKTFFVNQTVMVLDALYGSTGSEYQKSYETILGRVPNELEPNNFAIYFDAWANDNDDDPLLSILYTIVKKYRMSFPNDTDWEKVFCGVADLVIDNPLTAGVTLGFNKVVKKTASKVSDISSNIVGKNILEELEKVKNIEKRIHDFFEKILEKRGSERIVIFIDELDRCKPSYSVKLLERIKHYMVHENITFVFSTNISELSHTISHCYGTGFDGYKYLEKFFSEIYTLAELEGEQLEKVLQLDLRKSLHDKLLKLFILNNNVPLRTSLKISKKIKQFTPIISEKDLNFDGYRSFRGFAQYLFIPYLICLKLHNNVSYNEFIQGNDAGQLSFLLEVMKGTYLHESFYQNSNYEATEENNREHLEQLYKNIFSRAIIGENIELVAVPNNAKQQILKRL